MQNRLFSSTWVWGVKKLKNSTQTKKYGCWRTISSKASLCQYRRVWAQKFEEIDANKEKCVLPLELRGGGVRNRRNRRFWRNRRNRRKGLFASTGGSGLKKSKTKWNPSFKDDCWPNYRTLKSFTFCKVSVKLCNLMVLVYKGSPHMNEMIPIPWRWLLAKFTSV